MNNTIKTIVGMYKFIGSNLKQVNVSFSDKQGSPKACFYNAEKFAIKHKAIYVMGYIDYDGIPIEHAFVKAGNSYLDVTLGYCPKTTYYSVVEIPYTNLPNIVKILGSGHVTLADYNRLKAK